MAEEHLYGPAPLPHPECTCAPAKGLIPAEGEDEVWCYDGCPRHDLREKIASGMRMRPIRPPDPPPPPERPRRPRAVSTAESLTDDLNAVMRDLSRVMSQPISTFGRRPRRQRENPLRPALDRLRAWLRG